MLFNTIEFVIFLFVTTFIYWMIVPNDYKKHVLIGIGILFYFLAGQFIRFFIVGLDFFVFWIGRLIFKYEKNAKKKKTALIIGLVGVIGSLIFFKYTNFLIDIIESIAGVDLPALNIIMPLGISFFTFEFVHYLVDIYFGKIKPHSLKDFLLFSFFYPTLVSGPIKRFQKFIDTFHRFNVQLLFRGALIVLLGYFYKFVLADALVPLTEVLQNPEVGNQYSLTLSLYAYNFRLFFDFAGYSLIAIGAATLLGFRVPQNFNKPFIATNPSEFWKRWHMSLSSWIRDYIFIFLGGSRRGMLKTILNIFIIMSVFGLWHGAGMNFLVWGLYHGAGLAIYHALFKKLKMKGITYGLLGIFITFNFVTFSWVFFATNSLSDSFIAISKILLL